MKTYKIELTDEEYSALAHMAGKGWDYLIDGDYFYGEEEEQPAYEAALEKLDHAKPEEK